MQITLQHELQLCVTVTMVTSDTAQVVSYVLCPLNILPVSADEDVGGRQDRMWADNASPIPAWCAVNRGVRIIKFNLPRSTEFDQRSTSAVHSNMQS